MIRGMKTVTAKSSYQTNSLMMLFVKNDFEFLGYCANGIVVVKEFLCVMFLLEVFSKISVLLIQCLLVKKVLLD